MKKIRIIVLTIFCILMSGCSAEYTLKIDENLKFTESIIINENIEYFNSINQTADKYVNFNKKFYENDSIYKGFNYEVDTSNGAKLNAIGKSMSMETFNNFSIVYGTLFSSIYAEEKDGELTVKTTDYQGINFFSEPYSLGDPSYETAKFSIKTPLKMIKSNADIVDEKKGVYTWDFSKNGSEHNIEIVLDTNVDMMTRILTLIKKYWFIPIFIIIVIAGTIKLIAANKKNNEI